LLGVCDDYQLPYHNAVPADPKLEEMHKVVVLDGQRPVIANQWRDHMVSYCIWLLICLVTYQCVTVSDVWFIIIIVKRKCIRCS